MEKNIGSLIPDPKYILPAVGTMEAVHGANAIESLNFGTGIRLKKNL